MKHKMLTSALLVTLIAGPAAAQPQHPEVALDMLVFSDLEHFQSVFTYLEELQSEAAGAGRDDIRLAPVFQDYTQELGFESLLTWIESRETELENAEGREGSRLLMDQDPDSHHIADPYFRGLLSPQSDVMVGKTIYHFKPNGYYQIPKDELEALDAIRLGENLETSRRVSFVAYKVAAAAATPCCISNLSNTQTKTYLNGNRRIISKQWVYNNSLIHRMGARTRHYRSWGPGWIRDRADTIEVFGSAGFGNPACGTEYSTVPYQDYRTDSRQARDSDSVISNGDFFNVNTFFDTTHKASEGSNSVSDVLSMCECLEAEADFTLPSSAIESTAVYLDGSNSQNELSYLIEIFRVPSVGSNTNQGGAWSSWFSGQAGSINLSSYYNFTHTGGGNATVYRVRFGVRNGCTALDDQIKWIAISSDDFDVAYRSYVQGSGWQGWVYNGTTSGTVGQSKRMEAVKIKLLNTGSYSTGICYRPHVRGNGWMSTQCNGATAGTTGQNRRMEAVKIWLTNPPAGCNVEYRAHVKGQGWRPWVSNGQTAGTTGQNRRMEALEVRLVGTCP